MARKTLWIRSVFAASALFLSGCESIDPSSLPGIIQGAPTSGVLTNAEIDAGLREALTVGTGLVANQLGKTDGYFADPTVRIPLPERWREAQTQLKKVGMSSPLDDLELRMNRAAEGAIPAARDLVIGAIRDMTIEDAIGILRGGETAATDFLRAKTEAKLETAFTPYVRDALAQSGAFTSMERAASSAGFAGATTQLQSDLTTHAVDLGLDGLFHYVALEEKKIRENPVARTTEILRRVFGARV